MVQKNGERYSRSPFIWGVFFGGRVPAAEITGTTLARLKSLFQSDEWAHTTCFSQQSSLFSFGLGRSMFCTHLSQTNFALSAASNFSLSFCTSHGPKSPVLLNTRDL
jgi:hypothetical protein